VGGVEVKEEKAKHGTTSLLEPSGDVSAAGRGVDWTVSQDVLRQREVGEDGAGRAECQRAERGLVNTHLHKPYSPKPGRWGVRVLYLLRNFELFVQRPLRSLLSVAMTPGLSFAALLAGSSVNNDGRHKALEIGNCDFPYRDGSLTGEAQGRTLRGTLGERQVLELHALCWNR
jgi:hypothetical protein